MRFVVFNFLWGVLLTAISAVGYYASAGRVSLSPPLKAITDFESRINSIMIGAIEWLPLPNAPEDPFSQAETFEISIMLFVITPALIAFIKNDLGLPFGKFGLAIALVIAISYFLQYFYTDFSVQNIDAFFRASIMTMLVFTAIFPKAYIPNVAGIALFIFTSLHFGLITEVERSNISVPHSTEFESGNRE